MRELFRYNITNRKLIPNRWDIAALLIVFTLLALLATGTHQMVGQYQFGQPITISLSPTYLPDYALETIIRMFIALFFSLLFTFTIGTLAAKNPHAEKIIIPIIDILQSVPVMGFLSITVIGFIRLFPGSLLGAECAAIFAVFTAQVWNMALSFYQSLRTLPNELVEASEVFHLSAWQRFWRVEVPFAMPGLLWNTMLSMSASWFFLVASESVTVANQTITLPGFGSYVALAIAHKNLHAVIYSIVAMFIVIFLYDQLLFRPLVKWADRFRYEQTSAATTSHSWVANLFGRTTLMKRIEEFLAILSDKWINFPAFNRNLEIVRKPTPLWVTRVMVVVWYGFLLFIITTAIIFLWNFIFTAVNVDESKHVFVLGFFTMLRVFATLCISTLLWVPLGVWIGLRPQLAQIVQPMAQFLAAFPVNLVFPLFVVLIVHFHLNINIWTTLLMLLGTQWYILFNVIAGATALPKDLKQAADNFGVKGWLWWKRLILPGIFPYYITGAITAVGSAWNTSTIAEIVNWGSLTLHANGLGAYIMKYGAEGSFPFLALGIAVMSLFVVVLNRILWRPLYNLAKQRYQLD